MDNSEKIIGLIIIPYLRGKEIHKINLQLKIEDATKETFESYLLTNKDPFRKSQIDSSIKRILLELNINDETKQDSYLNKNQNLYQLLIHLYRDGNHHLGELINLIENAQSRNATSKWILPAFLIGLISLGGALLNHYQHERFIQIVDYIKNFITKIILLGRTFMSAAKNAALIGMLTNSLTFIYKFKQILADDKLNISNKFYEIAFTFITSCLTFSAYIISFASSGTMTIFAGIFFVAASCVEILKASLSLVAANKNAIDHPTLKNSMTAIEKAQYYRSLYEYKSQRDLLILKICTTVLTSLSVAALTFFPVSWSLIAGCIGAMILAETIGEYVSVKLTNYYNNQLQSQISTIHGIDNNKNIELAETSDTMTNSSALKQLLTPQLSQTETTITYSESENKFQISTKIHASSFAFFKPETTEQSTQTSAQKVTNEEPNAPIILTSPART